MSDPRRAEATDPRTVRVTVVPSGGRDVGEPVTVVVGGESMMARVERLGRNRVRVVGGPEDDGAVRTVIVRSLPSATPGVMRREIVIDGWRLEVDIEPARRAELRERARRGAEAAGATGPIEVRAVIPGAVLSVAVSVGDDVDAGQPLLVVEAMKMQNELRAPRAGHVEQVDVTAGATVEVGQTLVVLR